MDENTITCLVADDIHHNRLLVRKLCDQQGLATIEAKNGREALDILETMKIDIALLDIMMPDIDGLTVCREIRKRYSLTEMPVLFLTARVEDRDLVEGFEAGANDYITKPINPTILVARINAQIRVLNGARAVIAAQQELARKKRMETIGLFAAGVAHNFNNLLGTILGSAELIKYTPDTCEDVKNATELIISAASRGSELTNSLLTFAKPKHQDICDNPEEIVRAALPLVRSTTKTRIEFQLDITDSIPALSISPADLSGALLELLKNAVESIDDTGEVKILVEPLIENEKPVGAEFTISDSGKGIQTTEIDRIFEPFFSTKNLDSTMGISLHGGGLGLSNVANIIQHSGGSITVQKSDATGTTIRFYLPAPMLT